MNPLKQIVNTVRDGVFRLLDWADPDGEEEDFELIDGDLLERDAAYLTTGLITAVRAIHKAHEAGENCAPYHEATADLMTSIGNSLVAVRIIQHLLELVSAMVDDEDVQQMVATIVATELGEDEDDDPRHHHH